MNESAYNGRTSDREGPLTTALRAVLRQWVDLDRSPCPPITGLHDYLVGALGEPQKTAIEEHFLHCDACLDTVALAQTDELSEAELARPAAPGPVTGRAADLAVRISRGLLQVVASTLPAERLPEASPVRGPQGAGGGHLRYSKPADRLTIVLDLFRGEGDEANLQVSLRELQHPCPTGLEVRLFHEGREIASSSTCGAPVLFEDLMAGETQVRVYRQGSLAGEARLQLEH